MGARLSIRSIDGRTVAEEVGYPFDQGRVVIGRGRSADVRVPHRTVSELHATLRHEQGGFYLYDEGSTNGTRVNGEGLVPHRRRRLQEADLLEVGVYVLSFHTDALVTEPLSADRTGELARQLLRQGRAGRPGAPPPATLSVIGGPSTGRSLRLGMPPARYRIGSAEGSELSIDDPELAGIKLLLVHGLDGATLREESGAAALHAGGQPVAQLALSDGDELQVGASRLLFEEPADAGVDALSDGDDESLPPGYRVDYTPPQPEQPTPQAAPAPAQVVAPRRDEADSSVGADLIIYTLAAAILALSVAALVILWGS